MRLKTFLSISMFVLGLLAIAYLVKVKNLDTFSILMFGWLTLICGVLSGSIYESGRSMPCNGLRKFEVITVLACVDRNGDNRKDLLIQMENRERRYLLIYDSDPLKVGFLYRYDGDKFVSIFEKPARETA